MRDLQLDFQPRRVGLLSLVVALAGMVLAADAWFDFREQGSRLSELDAGQSEMNRRIERLQRGEAKSPAGQRQTPGDDEKALQHLNSAIAVDWSGFFGRVDQATTEDVALLSIQPNLSARTVRLSGEARDMAAALAFADALRHPPLADVVLLSHKFKSEDGQRPVVFEIGARWSAN